MAGVRKHRDEARATFVFGFCANLCCRTQKFGDVERKILKNGVRDRNLLVAVTAEGQQVGALAVNVLAQVIHEMKTGCVQAAGYPACLTSGRNTLMCGLDSIISPCMSAGKLSLVLCTADSRLMKFAQHHRRWMKNLVAVSSDLVGFVDMLVDWGTLQQTSPAHALKTELLLEDARVHIMRRKRSESGYLYSSAPSRSFDHPLLTGFEHLIHCQLCSCLEF